MTERQAPKPKTDIPTIPVLPTEIEVPSPVLSSAQWFRLLTLGEPDRRAPRKESPQD